MRRSCRLALVALVLVAGGAAVRAGAEPPGEVAPAAPVATPPLGVSLSGGVSLGAYEAGFLYGLVSSLRRDGLFPRVLTGTSAGSINAFVGALEACTPGGDRPTESLLYRIWVPMGLDQLFVPKDATAISALSRAGFGAPMWLLRQRYLAGLDERCDLLLGFAVTREHARPIPLGESGTAIPRMSEHVLLRLRGRGLGRPPTLENATTRELGRHHLLLPLDGPDADPFEPLASTLLASSGFPLAFPPQEIVHCDVDVPDNSRPGACTRTEARPSRFVDGGFFDNRPIGLALSALHDVAADAAPWLAFIDPDLRGWPLPVEPSPGRTRDSALALIVGMLSDFIATARATELDRLIAHDPAALRALHLGTLYYPPASEPLGAFFGFIDVELRRFDFYLGLYHARRFLARERGVQPAQLPDEGPRADPAWRPLYCLRAVFDHDGDPSACDGDDLGDFRALARHAIERVAEDCVRAGAEGMSSEHPVCAAMARGVPPPRVPGVDGGEAIDRDGLPHFRRRRREAASDWTLRRLAELGFRFHDLGLRRGEGARAPLMLRERLGQVVDALAARQGRLARHLYGVVGDIGLNMIAYAPPRHLVHVLLGNRLEAGWSYTDPTSRWRWLRLELGLGLWGIDTLFSQQPIYFGLAPYAGVRFELLPLSRSLLQPRIGLYGGFLFSTVDRLLARDCDVTSTSPCSRPMAEAAISVALVSVLRLQLSGVWFPAIRAGERQSWSITPGIALQLPLTRSRR